MDQINMGTMSALYHIIDYDKVDRPASADDERG
jgi:hypothetical protein